jgi:predicted DNA-binding helix-hairpin-helix protein
MRFYGFSASEIVSPEHPNMNLAIDPKCNWALRNLDRFPVEVNRASYETLLRVPGIGVRGAQKIMQARRSTRLNFDGLRKLGVVLKRARFFITCQGKTDEGVIIHPDVILRGLLSKKELSLLPAVRGGQMRFEDIPELAAVIGGRGNQHTRMLQEQADGETNDRRNEFGLYL